jgi:hypothetical protein
MCMEEVEKLLRSLSQPQVAQTNPEEERDDEPAAE